MSNDNAILVTGGLGFIGSHIVAALLEDSDIADRIVVIDDESNCARPEHVRRTLADVATQNQKKAVLFVAGDVTNRKDLTDIFETVFVNCVIHCAGVKSVPQSIEDPTRYFFVNFIGTSTLLDTMKRFGCKQFIFSSSATVYGEPDEVPVTEQHRLAPITPYGRSKMLAEMIAQDWHAAAPEQRSVALLRYMNPVGAHSSALLGEEPIGVPDNLQPYIAQVATGERRCLRIFGNDFDTPDGTGVRDYIHVVDLAEAHIAAMKTMSAGFCEAVNLGRGVGVSVLQMHAAFEKACGRPLATKVCARRAGDCAQIYCDAQRADRLFGWRARLGVDEMCESTWRYLCKRQPSLAEQIA